jgi:hypothetical protein
MSTGKPLPRGSDATRRRSQRVIITLAITVRVEEAPQEARFEEETNTLVVNSHGALILLAAKVEKGQKLRLINRATREEQVCQVASFGPTAAGKTQVGVEFLKPSPDFWHISFPPEDWVVPGTSAITSDKA